MFYLCLCVDFRSHIEATGGAVDRWSNAVVFPFGMNSFAFGLNWSFCPLCSSLLTYEFMPSEPALPPMSLPSSTESLAAATAICSSSSSCSFFFFSLITFARHLNLVESRTNWNVYFFSQENSCWDYSEIWWEKWLIQLKKPKVRQSKVHF